MGRAVLGRATCVLVAVLVSASATVLAMAGAVQWQAPAGCPEGAVVERRVEELLGRVPAEHELHAVGVVHVGPPWRLELETTIGGRRQQRALEADDCMAVAEAAALILAVSVDPLGVTRGPAGGAERAGGREREGLPEAPARPAVEVSPSTGSGRGPVAAPERQRVRPGLRLRVGAGGEAGAVPGGTGGVRLGLAVDGERAFLQVEGSYWIDRFAVLRDGPPRSGAWVGLGIFAVQGGVRLGGPRVGVPLSAGLEAGGLRTRAEGLAGGRDVTLPWIAGVVGAGVQWSLSRRVALWGAVEGVLPLTRLRVRVGRTGEDDVVLHEPAVVGVRALAGISIRIAGGS
jgi:hypothetical protein